MSDRTGIEWTDATWNPVTGCTKVSPGCDNCYAKTFAERWRGTPGHYFERGFDVQLRPDKLTLPFKWKAPRRVFVNSMSDLFHDDVPDRFIAKVFAVMAMAEQHTFQVLTKRHARMRSLLSDPDGEFQGMVGEERYDLGDTDTTVPEPELPSWGWPLPNVWLGVSTEDQKWADIRIPALLDTPAAVRWISAEPLLGPIDLTRMGPRKFANALHPSTDQETNIVRRGLDWVVVGGESGPGARPMRPTWARSLRDQCAGAGVPFLFKQWGAWAPNGKRGLGDNERELCVGERNDLGMREVIERVGKGRAGRVLDGRIWDEYPAVAS